MDIAFRGNIIPFTISSVFQRFPASMNRPSLKQGYILGLLAYVFWGFFPLYFKLLDDIPALEIVVQRIIWSALFGSFLLLIWKHRGWWQELCAHPGRFAVLATSGLLVTANWTIYVWAVNNEHMLEASLGYYINPLVNVLLGMLLLKERLRRLQWLAVILAAIGVGQQIWQLGQFPWIALSLALTFGVYGLIRKQAPVAALPGLVVETWFMVPVALIWLLFFANGPTTQWSFWTTPHALLIAMAGPVTLIPLICFNAAARRLPYATLGFLQYLAPTLVLLQAVFLFGESLSAERLHAFIFIWVALVIYSVDTWLALKKWRAEKH
jgi:rarD protein